MPFAVAVAVAVLPIDPIDFASVLYGTFNVYTVHYQCIASVSASSGRLSSNFHSRSIFFFVRLIKPSYHSNHHGSEGCLYH
jgi:hypothetical protein